MEKIRAIDSPWHLAHSWELLKNPDVEWSYLLNTYRKWEWTIRGAYLQDIAKWVPYYESGKYDIAILHLDQSCINPRLGKSKLFREINKTITDIPKIIIMHGTPMYDGYTEHQVLKGGEVKKNKSDQFEYWEGIEDLVGDSVMVVNSHRAKQRWGWGDVIWHGMTPGEWWDLPKEPRIITTISPAGMSDEYYGRRFLESVRSILAEEFGIKHQWINVDYIAELDCKRYHKNAFDAYRDFIGRSLIYFNPTGDSPMPRARTEAMLSGACIVTTANHDEDQFIRSGENGFIVPKDAYGTANLLADLIYKYPKEAESIGEKGKATAQKEFHIDRFSSQWRELTERVIGGYSGADQSRISTDDK